MPNTMNVTREVAATITVGTKVNAIDGHGHAFIGTVTSKSLRMWWEIDVITADGISVHLDVTKQIISVNG